MAYELQQLAARPRAAETISALLGDEGGKSHPYIACHVFARSRDAGRNLADAVHFITNLHGRQPGMIDLAREKAAGGDVLAWLDAASRGFVQERAYLMQIVVAAGPLPSTPGQAEAEAAVSGQRHALEMLARSDRNGCALGAAMALVLDWRAVRAVIDAAAQRFGVALTPPALPSQRQAMALIDAVGSSAIERAIMFGAQQLLVQHRGLWDLLEARASARVGI